MAPPLILVVEDDEHEQEIYGRILWYNGFDVVFARDGLEGLTAARARTPDLILLDLVLPGLNGLELSAVLQGDAALAGVPVLVLSALPAAKTLLEKERYGWTGYIEKPTSPVAVLHEVESVVGRAPPPIPAEAAAPPARSASPAGELVVPDAAGRAPTPTGLLGTD